MTNNVDRLECKLQHDGVKWFWFNKDPRRTRYATLVESDGLRTLASRQHHGLDTVIQTARGRAVVRGLHR